MLFCLREGVNNILMGDSLVFKGGGVLTIFTIFRGNKPFLVFLGEVEINSGISRGGQSFWRGHGEID